MTAQVVERPQVATVEDARSLVNQAREGLLSAEQAIKKIIATKAWVALGYDSFARLWREEFSDIRIASEGMKAVVLYAMFDEGATPVEAAATLVGTGVGPVAIKAHAEVWADDIPVTEAAREVRTREIRVRQHNRKPPSGRRTVHVEFTAEEYGRFTEIAEKHGSNIYKVSEEAIRLHFDILERS